MHRRVTVNGKTYVEPTGDIGTFSEFVSHTAVQIEIEVAPKETAGVQYYPVAQHPFPCRSLLPVYGKQGVYAHSS